MMSRAFPVGSKRRRIIVALKDRLKMQPNEYSESMKAQKNAIQFYERCRFETNPLISVIVPAFNTPHKYLDLCVRSVVGQTYQNWELVIVDASTDDSASKNIRKCLELDTRIKIVKTDNKGISANTNIGIRSCKGEYVGFMDHDDVFEYNALEEVVRVINEAPDAGLIYSDEDKLAEDGSMYLDPHFKPDWSPHLLTHVNYITHFVVAKKDLVKKVGYLDTEKDGAQDYDLLLKLTDLGVPVRHIPKVLYHWRVAEKSTAADISNKPYVLKAGEKALADHFLRRGINASSKAIENMPGFYKTTYRPNKAPTIVITPFANKTLIVNYVKVLEAVGVLDDYKVLTPHKEGSGRHSVASEKNITKYLTKVMDKVPGDVVILNDFVFPENKSWANELAGLLSDKRVHAATPAILKKNRTIIDMGIVNQGPEKRLLFQGFEFGSSTPFGNTAWPRNVDELTGKVLAVRRNELKQFLKTKKALGKYSATAKNDCFNVVWANTVVFHANTPLIDLDNSTRFFNPNLRDQGDGFSYYANEQQLLDALLKVEQEDNK